MNSARRPLLKGKALLGVCVHNPQSQRGKQEEKTSRGNDLFVWEMTGDITGPMR